MFKFDMKLKPADLDEINIVDLNNHIDYMMDYIKKARLELLKDSEPNADDAYMTKSNQYGLKIVSLLGKIYGFNVLSFDNRYFDTDEVGNSNYLKNGHDIMINTPQGGVLASPIDWVDFLHELRSQLDKQIADVD